MMVIREATALAAVGATIGIGTALIVTTATENLLFGVKPKDAPTFISAALMLTCAALLVSWFPAVTGGGQILFLAQMRKKQDLTPE